MSKITSLLRSAAQSANLLTATVEQASPLQRLGHMISGRGFSSSSSASSDVITDFEHATGLERKELEGAVKGVDIFEEEWLTAPGFGTPEKPVVVTSFHAERIVGVPDPDDDSIIIWDMVREGEGPKQFVEGGEYFILKKIEPQDWEAGH